MKKVFNAVVWIVAYILAVIMTLFMWFIWTV